MNIKRVKISQKRQLTIPMTYYKELELENEAECFIKDDALVIRPVRTKDDDYFAEQILADLIQNGYKGDDLLTAFKERKTEIRQAVKKVIAQADQAAKGEGEYYTYDDIFNKEE